MQLGQVYKACEALTQAVNILSKYVACDKEKPLSKTYLSDVARKSALDFSRTDRYGIDHQVRKEYCNPLTTNFNQIAEYLNLKGLDILEIGADQLNNNESFLSKKIPHTLWTFSDLNPQTETFSKEYLHLDLISTSLKIEKTFDCIIGCNVLDTLPYDKLGIAFQNIFKLLNPNGFCLHLADQPFLGNAFFQAVSDMAESDDVFLPGSQRLNSIYKIPKSDFHRILNESKEIWPIEIKPFKFWSDQNCHLQILSAWNFSSQEIPGSNHMISRIKTIFHSHLKEIVVDELFGSSLVRAATINGLSVDTCSYTCCTVEEQLINKKYDNYFISTQKQQYSYKSYALKPEIMLRTSMAHVFLALKNPDHFHDKDI